VARRRKPAPPRRKAPLATGQGLPPLGVLEDFTAESLAQWRAAARNLERYSNSLFFDLERHRARHSGELIDAIRASAKGPIEFQGWARLVDHRYTNVPLSVDGSVKGDGGRFNIGQALNPASYTPFPALYVAEDFSTSYRERFGIDRESSAAGLAAGELMLRRASSFTSVALDIRLELLVDVGDLEALRATAAVLRKFTMPASIQVMARALRLKAPGLVRTAAGLQRQLLARDWRIEPVQYGLPANSQIFGRLCAAAGIHGILYPSVRDGDKRCLALFPQNWAGSTSFVELIGPSPPEVRITRLGDPIKAS
jgi:RES domain-containing protein